MSPVLRMSRVSRLYRLPSGKIHRAVKDVSLAVMPREIVGLVGETGAGKSTLARLAAGMETPDDGSVRWGSESGKIARSRRVQMIFQDPVAALDPCLRIRESIMEPLVVDGGFAGVSPMERLLEVCRIVALPEDTLERLPETLSGGELQRACLARALMVKPLLLVADEPVTSLDTPIRRDILSLMKSLVKTQGLGLLLISHDMETIGAVADRMLVMLSGMIVEEAPAQRLLQKPVHPYSRLLTCRLHETAEWREPEGTGGAAGEGCPFAEACPHRRSMCGTDLPGWVDVAPGHRVRCVLDGLAPATGSGRMTP